jgi:hypothetical protein
MGQVVNNQLGTDHQEVGIILMILQIPHIQWATSSNNRLLNLRFMILDKSVEFSKLKTHL